MMREMLAWGALVLGAEMAFADPAGSWRFEEGKATETAAALAATVGAPGLDGTAGVWQKGSEPVFDTDVPAPSIWDGSACASAGTENRLSLRMRNEDVAKGGSPVGGQVTVRGSDPPAQPADLTVEAFVKMERQMPHHALIASKRREKPEGASWSLSIDPAGRVRARFDTQPASDPQGPGFNQSFGSTGSMADEQWHHVALTYDHATQKADIYLDHVRCGGGVTKGALVYDGGDLVFGRGLDGWLDEVRLTAAVLHPEQFLRTTRFFSDMKPAAPRLEVALDQTSTRVQTALKPELERIGTLRPKGVKEIETSMWSLGCETLDRDLADWDAYKGFLEPLGIRRIRLQGGWARTEKTKGVYDFDWLDHIVDDALARGLLICLETSYGNRLYQADAGLGPGGPLPDGDETLAAWDRWVEAMVRRYAPRGVKEWMMYNEPNLRKGNSIEKVVAFNVRTAEVIKRVDPEARIAGLVSAGAHPGFIGGFLSGLAAQGKLELFHWVIYHGYGANPDAVYRSVDEIREMLRTQAPGLRLWQGEAGCASEEVQFALSGVDWSELSQAKWNARRMLGDLGHDVESSVFTITDLSYHKDFISRYGLLKTNPDNSIIKVKMAYYTVQNVVSIFNDSLERVPDLAAELEADGPTSCYAFRDKATRVPVIAFWDSSAIPSNDIRIAKATLTLKAEALKEPVWVDLVTGNVYAIPAELMTAGDGTCKLAGIPIYDAPAVVTDRSLLSFEPARPKKAKRK